MMNRLFGHQSSHFFFLSFVAFVGVILGIATVVTRPAFALDPIEELEQQKNELTKLLKLSSDATAPLEKELQALDSKIKTAQAGITAAKKQEGTLAKSIADREDKMGHQYEVFGTRAAAEYRRDQSSPPLMSLFSVRDSEGVNRLLRYQLVLRERDQELLKEIGVEIQQLETDKKNAQERQTKLASLEKEINTQAEFFRKEIRGAKAYQSELTNKIAVLSAQQQQILNARSGTSVTAVGDVPQADDFNASIAFKAQAPGDSFAVFSFGAFTHRNGMSQYGAKARAEAGQSVEEILQAYYPGSSIKKDYNVPETLQVDGVGRIPFEGQYLHGIAEMPMSWHLNAQKAQAIAARTYAIRRTSNGANSICTTEACQVYRNNRRGGDWEKAVNETKGWVLVDGGGSPVQTQYASTHGGYSLSGGWDTQDKSGSGNWSSRAWESIAKSPWFYKAWYTQAYSVNSSKCGRSHPWLSQQEFSDIINAWIVSKNPNGADTGRIQPVTINQCNVGGGGGNPYSMDELKNLANNSGGAVTRVNSVSVQHSNNAQTASVKLQTNRGEITISGDEFKRTFNLRAPGFLSIPQKSFAFFNVEYKP
jgi:peptidoglycan hydrolase-like amidase